MIKLWVTLLFVSFSKLIFSQTLYSNPACSENCKKCLSEYPPIKTTYKVDKTSNKIFRTFNDMNPDVLTDCTIIDENNWVCPGYGGYDKDYGKQYSVNGVVHWNDFPNIGVDKNPLFRYSCTYEKSIFGGYNVTNQIKRF